MKTTYQYRLELETNQKLILNEWLRNCQYWYNRMIGDRFDWWERNRFPVNACPLVCHLPELRDNPNYFEQKKQLTQLKQDLIFIHSTRELVDLSKIYSTVLQDVCDRVNKAFERFIKGDSNGKRSGRPRFKNRSRYRTLTFDGAKSSWMKFCTLNGKWLYLRLPGVGLVKVRTHRPLSEGFELKQVLVTKKADAWYISLILEDKSVPDFTPEPIIPNWDNSLGLDAVLNEDIYLATSEGENLPSLKPLRRNLDKLAHVSRRKNAKKKGSRSRRKLAKRESRIHQRIARSRKDFQYKTVHKLVRSGKKVFFHEKLNLAGLSIRNAPKQDQQGNYLPNNQSAKSGLNLSWSDAAFGQFFSILEYIAVKAGAVVIEVNPAYTSQLLAYRDDFVFTDCSIRSYWDEKYQLFVDRDINAAINIKRVGLGLFPTIKRRRGNPVVVASTTHSTSKEALTALSRVLEASAVLA